MTYLLNDVIDFDSMAADESLFQCGIILYSFVFFSALQQPWEMLSISDTCRSILTSVNRGYFVICRYV